MANENGDRLARGQSRKGASFPVAPGTAALLPHYHALLREIKETVLRTRLHTVLAANSAMVALYWEIGRSIVERQAQEGWGAKIIDRLSRDLREAFPEMKGFSPRNLKYMRAFLTAWPDREIVQQVLAQLTWSHNLALLEKLQDAETRLWYAKKTCEHGWSRDVLALHIQTRRHERQGRAATNFATSLPPADSDMAAQIFKDPYLFDFLGTADSCRDAELDQGLIDHIQKFLLKLGSGFALVGRQVHLESDDDDFYLDLLFYHLQLRCYVVIELKSGESEPGQIGLLNMYLNVVDDLLRHADDKPTIGLLLVKQKNQVLAEYALRGLAKPLGVAEWETMLTRSFPEELKSGLPTIEEIEAELTGDEE
jgi:predicted nuclease of restriction endonuclease-like (RecB) superfamily